MLRSPRTLLAIAAALALIVAACSEGGSSKSTAQTTSASGSAPAAATGASSRGAAGGNTYTALANTNTSTTATVDLVKCVSPSVVKVSASAGGRFGQQASGTGTGFITDDRGYIVTNNHVVTLGTNQEASSFKIDLSDGRSLDATLVGRDPLTDLAVLKINADKLAPVKFADPSGIAVGEDVVAVGFALDLGSTPTVTKGVISALDRVIQEQPQGSNQQVEISGAIQTDAAINPGNSGGPLLDMDGNVVGVNTAGLFGGAGRPVQGISFAVSSQVALPIVQDLINTGSVKRGFLGVGVRGVDSEIAQARQLAVKEGAILLRVDPGSAADTAGLRPGDVIVKIGDRSIKSTGDVTDALTKYGPGDKVKIEYYRGSERRTAEATLGQRPSGA